METQINMIWELEAGLIGRTKSTEDTQILK